MYVTATLSGTEQEVRISGQNCDVRNDSVEIVYASARPGIVSGADGVVSIPAGAAVKVLDTRGKIFLLGAGSVMLCGNDYSELVFKYAPTCGGESGADEQARAAIISHESNKDIHTYGRRQAGLIVRASAGAYAVPRIDWTGKRLIFDNSDGLLICTSNGYTSVSGASGSYEVPFVADNPYNFLVGSASGLKFISASEFTNSANWELDDQQYYFGWLNTTFKGYDFTFEVKEQKTLSVIGDSISTFAGYIPEDVPAERIYYDGTNAGVTTIHKMWWQIVCDKLGYERNTINAYGGSRVTNTNALGEATTGVSRATALDNGADPDIIIAYIGINDFNGGVALGDYVGKGVIPEDMTQFGAAYAKMLHNIQDKYKQAKIYCMTLPAAGANTADLGYPEANSAGLYQSEFNERIRAIARAFNCGIIEGESCGITAQNADVVMDDIKDDGWFLHPNAIGQQMIAEAVIRALKEG